MSIDTPHRIEVSLPSFEAHQLAEQEGSEGPSRPSNLAHLHGDPTWLNVIVQLTPSVVALLLVFWGGRSVSGESEVKVDEVLPDGARRRVVIKVAHKTRESDSNAELMKQLKELFPRLPADTKTQ